MPGLIRAVIDTSILVRAFLKPQGTVGPILDRLAEGRYAFVSSRPLLDELIDVLNRPRLRMKYSLRKEDVEDLLKLLLLRGEVVEPARSIVACRDPKDDKVLEAAVEGRAQFIVTGDEDLLVLSPFESILMVGPSEFLHSLPSP
ncbi:MAG TPA: putative toxin-antitoxin system toxin component, PIN family [Thermoanaerobaculia bacterium]|nr:putative toxin-antitoxin system toxin component, PIN family [Thermoanaerobaculia bacterium]